MEGGHQNALGLGSSIGLKAEADFASDDCRAKLSPREVIVRRDLTILSPSVHPIRMVMKDLLKADEDLNTTLTEAFDVLRGIKRIF